MLKTGTFLPYAQRPGEKCGLGALIIASRQVTGCRVDSSPTIHAELTVPLPDFAHSAQIMESGRQGQPLGMLEDDAGSRSKKLTAMNLFQGLRIALHGAVGRIDEDYIKLAPLALQDLQ